MNPEKKKQCLIVAGIGLGILFGLYMVIYKSQDAKVKQLDVQLEKKKTAKERAEVNYLGKKESSNKTALEEAGKRLAEREKDFPPDNRNRWGVWLQGQLNTIITDKGLKLSLKTVSSQPREGVVGMIAEFPYRQATFKVEMSGYYHDFGKFLAEFEGKYDTMRINGLDVKALDGMPQVMGIHDAKVGSGEEPSSSELERLEITFYIETLFREV
ncbi:MAG TPA: hypothetical protein EYQ50_09175 [Verrucomicrobiales bacterium]|nr:hypothetical protein [Verrucomicrobiales bacterium]